jgi:Flp pilus assembly protein CpaB
METAQRLVSTRRGAIILSLLAAIAAGGMILAYVARYRDSVKSETTPVTVLVASKAIPKGTAGSVIANGGMYTVSTIRQSRLLDGALSDPSSLTGQVAAHDVYPGAQLTASDFASAKSTLAASLAAGQRVVTIPLDAAHGLVGQLQVGDRVDVWAGFNVIPLDARGVPISGAQARPLLRLIVPDVTVVTLSSKAGGGLAGTGNANVGLKLTDAQVGKVTFASDNGKIWLALRSASGASAKPSLVSVETVLLGVNPLVVERSLGGRR